MTYPSLVRWSSCLVVQAMGVFGGEREGVKWWERSSGEAVGENEVLGKLDVTNLMVSSGSYIDLWFVHT